LFPHPDLSDDKIGEIIKQISIAFFEVEERMSSTGLKVHI
jgi:hypothetical protein